MDAVHRSANASTSSSSGRPSSIFWFTAERRHGEDSPTRTRVVFFQGIGAGMEQIRRVLDVPLPLFDPESLHVPDHDLPEVGHLPCLERALPLRFWHVNIVGRGDMEAMAERCRLARNDRKVPNEVHVGISRGASTTFVHTVLAAERGEPLPNFVVLEGCPDSIPNVLVARYGTLLADLVEKLLSWMTSYDPDWARTHSPLALAARFPKTVPVLLITSEYDTTVPAANTHRLRDALIAAGHPNVTFIVIPRDAKVGHDDYYGKEPIATMRYYHAMQMHFRKYC